MHAILALLLASVALCAAQGKPDPNADTPPCDVVYSALDPDVYECYDMFGKPIEQPEITSCKGACTTTGDKCEPNTVFGYIKCKNTVTGETTEHQIITECHCKGSAPQSCQRLPNVELFEVDVGNCSGECPNQLPSTASCLAGVRDQLTVSNNPDLPAALPSAALQTMVPLCKTKQTIFDASGSGGHNRVLCHTFNCAKNKCPITKAVLTFCARPLFGDAYNDNIWFNYGGVPGDYSVSFATLSGTSWSPSTVPSPKCFTIDFGTVPGFLAGLSANGGELDIVVQDDTAIDFFQLDLAFEDCQYCAPSAVAINLLATASGLQQIPSIEKCDCFNSNTACRREPLTQIYFPWDATPQRIDVGRCAGGCQPGSRCTPKFELKEIASSSGMKQRVAIVAACSCS